MLGIIGAKVIAMLGLGGSSFILGILPLWFRSFSRHHLPLAMSTSLCFGAGVLLATAIIHMLPEVREQVPKLAETVFCAGFFLLYFVDEVVHYFWTSNIDIEQSNSIGESSCSHPSDHAKDSLVSQVGHYGSTTSTSAHHCHEDTSLLCHTTYKEPCVNSPTSRIGLFIALTLHSTLEGLAIGLQDTVSKVFLLVGAVACHKLVVALCLGIELVSGQVQKWNHVSQISVFSVGCSAGVGIGIGISQLQNAWTLLAIPIMQGIAGGTLFYVTVCEVLPRERAKWHHQTRNRAAGICQFLAVFAGFSLILILNILFAEVENGVVPNVGNN